MRDYHQIPRRHLVALATLHEDYENIVDSDELSKLLVLGLIRPKYGGGWTHTRQGRELLRNLQNTPGFRKAVRDDWPVELIAHLKLCQHTSTPRLSPDRLDNLRKRGFLEKADFNIWRLTHKGKELLARYPV